MSPTRARAASDNPRTLSQEIVREAVTAARERREGDFPALAPLRYFDERGSQAGQRRACARTCLHTASA